MKIIHSVFLTRKSRDGRSAIDWQPGATARQLKTDRSPRDNPVRETLWIVGLSVNSFETGGENGHFAFQWDDRS